MVLAMLAAVLYNCCSGWKPVIIPSMRQSWLQSRLAEWDEYVSNDDNQHRCVNTHEHPKIKFENI